MEHHVFQSVKLLGEEEMPTNDWITDLIEDLTNAFGNANDPCAKAALVFAT